jgi:hypothetical protein
MAIRAKEMKNNLEMSKLDNTHTINLVSEAYNIITQKM